MIADAKIYAAIEARFPELQSSDDSGNFYRSFDDLSRQAREWIREENVDSLEECLLLVNKLYEHSSTRVRNAIENVFIFRIIHPLQQSQQRFEIKRRMPEALRNIIYRHIYHTAI